jgi:hypothetical protein
MGVAHDGHCAMKQWSSSFTRCRLLASVSVVAAAGGIVWLIRSRGSAAAFAAVW